MAEEPALARAGVRFHLRPNNSPGAPPTFSAELALVQARARAITDTWRPLFCGLAPLFRGRFCGEQKRSKNGLENTICASTSGIFHILHSVYHIAIPLLQLTSISLQLLQVIISQWLWGSISRANSRAEYWRSVRYRTFRHSVVSVWGSGVRDHDIGSWILCTGPDAVWLGLPPPLPWRTLRAR